MPYVPIADTENEPYLVTPGTLTYDYGTYLSPNNALVGDYGSYL